MEEVKDKLVGEEVIANQDEVDEIDCVSTPRSRVSSKSKSIKKPER